MGYIHIPIDSPDNVDGFERKQLENMQLFKVKRGPWSDPASSLEFIISFKGIASFLHPFSFNSGNSTFEFLNRIGAPIKPLYNFSTDYYQINDNLIIYQEGMRLRAVPINIVMVGQGGKQRICISTIDSIPY